MLQEFHSVFQGRLKEFKEQTEDAPLFFKTFSDNVLLACPDFSSDMEFEFASIMWLLREYQLQMALKGFFIRGGLSVGPLFISENNVYGKALIEAYELESQIAINPIVVLSSNLMRLIDQHLQFYAREAAPQTRDIMAGADGRYFINYLAECILEMDSGNELDADSLHQHKARVEEGLALYEKTPKVFSKFSWLASYHNYFCNTVKKLPGYDKSLKIPDRVSAIKFHKLR